MKGHHIRLRIHSLEEESRRIAGEHECGGDVCLAGVVNRERVVAIREIEKDFSIDLLWRNEEQRQDSVVDGDCYACKGLGERIHGTYLHPRRQALAED